MRSSLARILGELILCHDTFGTVSQAEDVAVSQRQFLIQRAEAKKEKLTSLRQVFLGQSVDDGWQLEGFG